MLTAVLLLLLTGDRAAEASATYVVRMASLGDPLLRVEAAFPVRENRIAMDFIQAEHLKDGWGTFVRELVVKDGSGATREPKVLGNGAWEILGAPVERVSLSYAVDLAFTREPWPAGNEQAGYAVSNALYLVTKALFIGSDAPGERRVKFDVPADWTVSAPWSPAADDPRTFVVADWESLVRNSLVLGNHRESRLDDGPLDLTLVLLEPVDRVAPLVESALAKVLPAYLSLFPRTPPSRHLMTFFQAYEEDGEGFLDSSAFTTTEPVEEGGVLLWGSTLAHELFHHWNGQRIVGAGEREAWQWFSEGFTEYVANLTLLQTGVIDEALWQKKLERHLGNYLYFKSSPAFPPTSLVEAGKQKGTYRFGVYDGGWAIAFALDGLIREGSGDQRDLGDFFSALYERFTLAGEPFDLEAFAALASDTAETDLLDFFERHVRGREVLPLRETLARFGLRGQSQPYAGELYVWHDPAPSPQALARRQSLVSGN